MRSSKSTHLTKLLSSQATYLYHFACLMTYKDVQRYEVQQLIEWAINASPDIDLQQFRIEFIDKTTELNLRSCQPKSFTYNFTTIWDTIHFLSIIIDDMIETRDKNSIDLITQQLKTMKILFYNIFFILNCAMCRDHYMNVKGFIIYHIEILEIALDKEKYGNSITFVDTYPQENILNVASESNETNVVMKHLMAYVSMCFHNHINDYRWIQRNKKPPIHHEKMSWSEYKKMLNF